jgi:hypothetical protein
MALMQDGGGGRVKIPLLEVVALAYRRVFGRLGLMFELGWLPILVLLALSIVPALVLGHGAVTADDALGFDLPELLEMPVALLCLTAFAVRWHQAMLFAQPSAMPRGLFPRAWGRFLLYALITYAVSFAILGVLIVSGVTADMASPQDVPPPAVAAVAGVLAVLTFVLWLVTARLALLFPASAYGEKLSWPAAWRLMRGNTWRLLGCGILAGVPFMLAMIVLLSSLISASQIGDDGASPLESNLGLLLLRGIVETLSNFILVALIATILSEFYRRIVLGRSGPAR